MQHRLAKLLKLWISHCSIQVDLKPLRMVEHAKVWRKGTASWKLWTINASIWAFRGEVERRRSSSSVLSSDCQPKVHWVNLELIWRQNSWGCQCCSQQEMERMNKIKRRASFNHEPKRFRRMWLSRGKMSWQFQLLVQSVPIKRTASSSRIQRDYGLDQESLKCSARRWNKVPNLIWKNNSYLKLTTWTSRQACSSLSRSSMALSAPRINSKMFNSKIWWLRLWLQSTKTTKSLWSLRISTHNQEALSK